MKLNEMAGVAAGYDIQKASKRLVKQQAAANNAASSEAQRRAHWEAQMMEHMVFQSQTLSAIRDLLARQVPRPETPTPPPLP